MKFTTVAGKLLQALSLAATTVDRKDHLKSCFLIEAPTKKKISIKSTTGHSGSFITIPAECSKPGKVIVSGDRLIAAVRECEEDTEFEVVHNNLVIKCGELEQEILIVSEDKKFSFIEKTKFDSIVINQTEMAGIMKLILPAVGMVRESDFKGVSIASQESSVVMSSVSRNSGAGFYVDVKCKTDGEKHNVIASQEFAEFIVSLQNHGSDIGIGIDKSSIAVRHDQGYAYFPLLTGKPIEYEKFVKLLALEKKPALCSAGLLHKKIKSAMVMSDKEEGYKGKLEGSKGTIAISSYCNSVGASKNTLITAGDLEVSHWYNFRVLRDYLSKIPPEDEIGLHTALAKHAAALVVRYGGNVFWLVSCPESEERENAQAKRKGKNVP